MAAFEYENERVENILRFENILRLKNVLWRWGQISKGIEVSENETRGPWATSFT